MSKDYFFKQNNSYTSSGRERGNDLIVSYPHKTEESGVTMTQWVIQWVGHIRNLTFKNRCDASFYQGRADLGTVAASFSRGTVMIIQKQRERRVPGQVYRNK